MRSDRDGRRARRGADGEDDFVALLRSCAATHPELLLDPAAKLPETDDRRAGRAARLLGALEPAQIFRALAGGLIVDLDDTLIVNAALYRRSRFQLLLAYRRLGAAISDPIALARELDAYDASLVGELGYTPERWRTSACRFCERLLARELSTREQEHVLQAAEVALAPGWLYPGVERTLTTLRRAGVRMFLWTKGAPAMQREKIERHRLERFFQGVEIVADKSGPLLRRLASAHGLERATVIGDSLASDIAPALELGLPCIHIDRGRPAWRLEDDERVRPPASAPSFPLAVWSALRAGGAGASKRALAYAARSVESSS
jgi:putative hydrolase of the HAD superfamily